MDETTSAPTLREIIAWLDDFLDAGSYADFCPNGLQVEAVEPTTPVRRVVTGVSANLALIRAATARDADLLLVHHGIFWTGASPALRGALGRRTRSLFGGRLSLAAYHLPLDAHAEVGNAATLARVLGVGATEPAFEYRGSPVGLIGRFPEPRTLAQVVALIEREVSPSCHVFGHGPEAITRVGIATGGAPREAERAVEIGCDLFITGEAGEYSQASAAEEGFHFIAAGHHRTERFGPEALGRRLGRQFPALEVGFVDVDNPA